MNIVCIGAHPDDCEFHAGGSAVLWAQAGFRVLFVSVTNGDAGHHELGGAPLVRRRKREAEAAARIAGVETRILEYHDGELTPSMDVRRDVVSIIREWNADCVITHRPWDYHPDHRYTATVVQDAAYMVMVPNFCPAVAPLRKNPVFMYMVDRFQKPYPFRPDVAVDVSDVMDTKWSMLDAMDSQVYEWLPWTQGVSDQVPTDPAERLPWLKQHFSPVFQHYTALAKPGFSAWYSDKDANRITFAEAFEICEYGRTPSRDELHKLFPFIPQNRD